MSLRPAAIGGPFAAAAAEKPENSVGSGLGM